MCRMTGLGQSVTSRAPLPDMYNTVSYKVIVEVSSVCVRLSVLHGCGTSRGYYGPGPGDSAQRGPLAVTIILSGQAPVEFLCSSALPTGRISEVWGDLFDIHPVGSVYFTPTRYKRHTVWSTSSMVFSERHFLTYSHPAPARDTTSLTFSHIAPQPVCQTHRDVLSYDLILFVQGGTEDPERIISGVPLYCFSDVTGAVEIRPQGFLGRITITFYQFSLTSPLHELWIRISCCTLWVQ
jgi:hypothetical protein